MEPGTVGGLGVAYFGIFYFLLPLVIGAIVFKCLPKRLKLSILERIDNIE
ncbi:MAG: hypothetical protein K0R18_546 [Bacillales bacterium]|jgi:hypothetical protein|nr:hypothetical protein [Bacillales bacterium]